ncbi:MAG TPA: alpha/beta fold hydrolase [Chitinophagaceae bacterium]|nr:alpha/beta fold hydrolase [Chitinophagaceae bacterium]
MKVAQRLAIGYIRTKFKLLAAVSKSKAAREAFELFCTPQFRNINKPDRIFATAEQLEFRFRDYRIAGYRWNKGGDRKVLIVHGYESSASNFGTLVGSLISKGYEVLAFDAPAHGRSSGKSINALVYRDLIKHIHMEFGPVKSYIAHSFGGLAVALALAETPHDESYRVALIAPAAETKTALDHFFHLIRLDDAAVRKEFEKIIVEISGHGTDWFSIDRTLQSIEARVLWIQDEDDNVTPVRDAWKVNKKNYSNIKFVFTSGLGHRRIYRDPEVGKTIVGFI